MKIAACLAIVLAAAAPAFAQTPVAGAVVERFEMAPDRTVIFAPRDMARCIS
jgi:hypothetical protein